MTSLRNITFGMLYITTTRYFVQVIACMTSAHADQAILMLFRHSFFFDSIEQKRYQAASGQSAPEHPTVTTHDCSSGTAFHFRWTHVLEYCEEAC